MSLLLDPPPTASRAMRPAASPSSVMPPVWGSTALAPRPRPAETPRRAPLRTVPPRPARRPTTRYAVIAIASIVVMALGQLLISIALSSGAYELARLRGEAGSLALTAAALDEDLALLGSPQSLAQSAAAMGMVQAGTPSYLRLSDGGVLGAPQRAGNDRRASTWAARVVPNGLLAGFVLPVLGTIQPEQAEDAGSEPAPAGAGADSAVQPAATAPGVILGPRLR